MILQLTFKFAPIDLVKPIANSSLPNKMVKTRDLGMLNMAS